MGLITLLYSDPSAFIILSTCLIFSLCFHEFSHSITAYYLGDDTSYRMGRANLNPLNHLDPIGTLMILFIGFGWAKPVPVNHYNLENPKSDMMKIAFAGPASNLLIAFLVLLIAQLFDLYDYSKIIVPLYWINVALAVFNMLPITPLDGSQIFNPIISKYNRNAAVFLSKNGPNVLLAIIFISIITNIPILSYIITPIISLITNIFEFIISWII
ncbi:MAG: site-2 protease family protein [Candidatus Marinimicrobia bacterium]|nr:site-2 protease family protein [Candidatus Neomarinimicrobiota bacterium]